MRNDIIELEHKDFKSDEIGNQIAVTVSRMIFCQAKSIRQSEFYSAAMAGIKPEITFIIGKSEYKNESSVRYQGLEYSVIRTYSDSNESLELVCKRVTQNG